MTADGFLKELQKLILSHPKPMTHTLNSENSEYGDQLYYCKNMLYCFDTVRSADCMYIFSCISSVNSMDCNYVDESQLCYECVDSRSCFNSNFLEYCMNVRDSSFSASCRDCHDIFGCVNLVGKSFCIFNRQLSEEEYRQKINFYKSMPQERVLEMVEELKKRFPLTQARGLNNENSPYGNYVYNSKNSYMCFDSLNNENCGYLFDSGDSKDTYDTVFSEYNELCYEMVDSGHNFNCNYAVWSGNCQDSSYIISSVDLKNCLGCVDLFHKEYCILNRQFSKEEYERISAQILNELKNKNLGWGNLVY